MASRAETIVKESLMSHHRLSYVVCVFALLPALTHAAGDPINGKALYEARCVACHSADFNGVGPSHRGVFGRIAGKVGGFAYSPALKSSNVVWNEANLDRWLADPEKLVPGQRMGLNVAEGTERADLIAYLKQLTKKEETQK
jgi:cytochrome c